MTKAIVAVLLMISICGCQHRTVLVHYVLPNGFRGPLRIMEGQDDSNGYSFDGVQHVYHFPASGTIRVKTTWPLTEWHRITVQYEDGSPVYLDEHGSSGSDPDAIRVRELGASTDYVGPPAYWDVVGNEGEVNRWQQEWNSGELQRKANGSKMESSHGSSRR